ncbi:MAG: hypothetical protein ACQESC_03710 [Nanobdellota archaeon]
MVQKKIRLTKDEEFQMMKMIMDKFALLGVLLTALGIALLAIGAEMIVGYFVMTIGLIILLVFAWILIKEVHILKRK